MATANPHGLGEGTQRRIALEVLLYGPLPRIELARRLGLSPASLTRLSRPLIDSGVFTEAVGTPDGRDGRPSRPLDVVPGARHFVGVELRHDSIYGSLTSLRAVPVARARADLGDRRPGAVIKAVSELVGQLSEQVPEGGGPVAGLGVSIGGLVPDHNVVKRAPFLGWTVPVALGVGLRETTGLPTVVDNDLIALTKAQHWFGAARGRSHFAVISLGVGIGYGLTVHDRTVESEDAGVGLVGHYPVLPDGPPCDGCGRLGCAQAMLASPSIARRLSAELGRPTTFEEVLALAVGGHPLARGALAQSGAALGTLIAAVANITMAPMVLVTGEGVGLGEVARASVEETLLRARDPYAAPVEVCFTPVDYDQWARGAATAAIQAYVLRN